MVRFALLMTAVAALPLAWGVTRAAVGVVVRLCMCSGSLLSAEIIALTVGFVGVLVLLLVLPKPMRLYVFEHELTHAIWGVLFGERVESFKVSPYGGSVTFKARRKPRGWMWLDIWMTLAPYFFPLYTVLVILAALITRCFVSPLPGTLLWLAAVSGTWCFHVYFTIESLLRRQSDIEAYGRVFSYVFIWIINVMEVALAVVCTTEITWRQWTHLNVYHTEQAYHAVKVFFVWLYELVCTLPFL